MLDFIKSPLEYIPLEIGKAKLYKKGDLWCISNEGREWMGYNTKTMWQAHEFLIELHYAQGICITTGLGLGIIQTILCQNINVSKLKVYEKNKDIIEIFYKLVEHNKINISKLEIINYSADEMKNETCDCLFLDHFEGESEAEVLERSSKIEKNNNTNMLWYWPAAWHYLIFLEKRRLTNNVDSYLSWKEYTKLKSLPNFIDNSVLEKFKVIKEMYLKNASGVSKEILSNYETRNKLIEKFAKRGIKK